MTRLKLVFKGPFCGRFWSLSIFITLFFNWGASHAQVVQDFSSTPTSFFDSDAARVMLAMSRDHQLWYKAYSDYTDLNDDGVIETGYNDNIDYDGYFNYRFCYEYTGNSTINYTTLDNHPGDGEFKPKGKVQTGHQCDGSTWSGNFLNWLTMTRIDVLRKVLYGGTRVKDEASSSTSKGETILQRAMIPSDNHAFAKVVVDSNHEDLKTDRIIGWNNTSVTINDFTPLTSGKVYTFCNVTDTESRSHNSSGDNITNDEFLPRLKVVEDDNLSFRGWSLAERNQCIWEADTSNENTQKYTPTSGKVFNVKVQVCVPGQDESYCRRYVSDTGIETFKPSGILQEYGEPGKVEFGLITGSSRNSRSGGVLRKAIGRFSGTTAEDHETFEVNLLTGQFLDNEIGIVTTLDNLRIYGWARTYYSDCTGAGNKKEVLGTRGTKRCSSWGNPISEIYYEALRYFAGESAPTPNYVNNVEVSSSADSQLELAVDNWNEFEAEQCSKCFILMLSTGINSFDGDDIDQNPLLTSSLSSKLDSIEENESLSVGQRLISDGEVCNPGIVDLNNMQGVCPEVPSQEGSYDIAGLALNANTQNIVKMEDSQENDQGRSLPVKTFAVSLAQSLPSFNIGGVTILPLCQSSDDNRANPFASDNWLTCTFIDVRVEQINEKYGYFVITWEDSSWGSDYDQDAVSVLEYCLADSLLIEDNDYLNKIEQLFDEYDLNNDSSESEFIISINNGLANSQLVDVRFNAQALLNLDVSFDEAQEALLEELASLEFSSCGLYSSDQPSEDNYPMDRAWFPANDGTDDWFGVYYDNDELARLSQFSNIPQWNDSSENEVQIRLSVSTASGTSVLRFGYTVIGAESSSTSQADSCDADNADQNGTYFDCVVRQSGYDFGSNVFPTNTNHTLWSEINSFQPSNVLDDNYLLKNPLWYAA